MEFLKDYELELNYHPDKANIVADALSRKSLNASWMMIKESLAHRKFLESQFGNFYDSLKYPVESNQGNQQLQRVNSTSTALRPRVSKDCNSGAIKKINRIHSR